MLACGLHTFTKDPQMGCDGEQARTELQEEMRDTSV